MPVISYFRNSCGLSLQSRSWWRRNFNIFIFSDSVTGFTSLQRSERWNCKLNSVSVKTRSRSSKKDYVKSEVINNKFRTITCKCALHKNQVQQGNYVWWRTEGECLTCKINPFLVCVLFYVTHGTCLINLCRCWLPSHVTEKLKRPTSLIVRQPDNIIQKSDQAFFKL